MNTGNFVYIDYVGRIKDSGEIFDLTKEDVAKKEKVYNPNLKYKPVPIIIDADFILKGLNEGLKEMKVGEKRKIEIKPDKGFGERNPDLVLPIPLIKFKEQNIEPKIGSIVTISGMKGRITTVSGGRVMVDFNHPLAGKTLEYEVEIVSEVKETKEKVEAIVFYFTGIEKEDINTKIGDKEVEIEFKKKEQIMPKEAKEIIAKTIKRWVKPLERIKYVEVFE